MNLKSSDIKRLLDEIVEEEKEEHGLTFDFHYIGKLNFVKNMNKIYKRKLKLIEKKEIIKCSTKKGLGFSNNDADIIVVFKGKKLIKLYGLTTLIYIIYHEICHAKDDSRDYLDIDLSNYDDLIYFIDRRMFPIDSQYYNDTVQHELMSFEILADMYAVKKTKGFFEKHPEIKCNEGFLNNREEYVNARYETYDLSHKIDKIINEGYYIYKEQDVRKTTPFSIFLKDDGTFKHMDDILKDPVFHELDQRIINGFLKSENFKNSLLDSDISQEAQDYLGNLYGSMKSKKLVIQKQEKYEEINNEIKQSKIVLAKSLGAYILLIFEWVFAWVLFKNQPEIYNYFELFNIGMLGSLFLLDVKEIINKIRNKYDYIYSVTDEEIDDFIGILKQNQQDNHEKSL